MEIWSLNIVQPNELIKKNLKKHETGRVTFRFDEYILIILRQRESMKRIYKKKRIELITKNQIHSLSKNTTKKYAREIEKAIEQIVYEPENEYIKDADNRYRYKTTSDIYLYPIYFYALYLNSKSKIIIFNHKIFKDYQYKPKFLWEFDVTSKKSDPKEILMEILTREAIKRKQIYDGNKYIYSRIEFRIRKRGMQRKHLIDDIYFANIVCNKVEDCGIVQFLEELV